MTMRELIYQLHQRGIFLACDGDELLITGNTAELSEQDIAKIKVNKAELLEILGSGLNIKVIAPSFENEEKYQAPTSSLQRNIYFLESLSEGQRFYNVPVAFKVDGNLNIDALKCSIRDLCIDNDILRTVYQYQNNELIQVVEAFNPDKLHIPIVHIKANELDVALRKEANTDFDLQLDWPIKVTLFAVGADYVLSLTMHHIAVDGFSAKIIVKSIERRYAHYCSENKTEYSLVKRQQLQYADYSKWHSDYLKSSEAVKAKNYWQNLLKDSPSCHNFPLEYTRPSSLSVEGEVTQRKISGYLFDKIFEVAQDNNISVFLLLQSIFAGFMARMGDEQDLIISSVYANRLPTEFAQSIGMFANTIPFRYQVEESTDLKQLISATEEQHTNAMKFQQYPFELMLDGLTLERDSSYNPLVQVQFVLQESSLDKFELIDTRMTRLDTRQPVAKFDFSLHVSVSESQITIDWEYNTNLFSRGRLNQFFDYFLSFIEAHVEYPSHRVMHFQFREQLVARDVIKNNFGAYLSNPEIIENIARQTPSAIAVQDENKHCSYESLVSSANCIIAGLQATGIGKGERISVYMEKSLEQVIVMYAVMRAGYTYVPLDPSYPEDRLSYICENSDAKGIIYNSARCPSQSITSDIPLFRYEELIECKLKVELTNIEHDDPAYIIYTSGSTGKPKGVQVPHGSIYYSLQANKKVYQFSSKDSMPTIGSQAFGVSLLETFVPLIAGGTVQTLNKEQVTDINELIDSTQDSTVIHMVPSLMAQWLDMIEKKPALYPKLRLLLVGAEPVPPILLRRLKLWRDSVVVRVLYGMTESSVVSSGYLSSEHDGNGYSIGKPHPNMKFYTMNRFGSPQPIGVPGELYVGGLSLAQGYVGLPEITKDKFIHHGKLNERLYKTGDRARLLPSGHFEFLGRVDHQVSLRGIRIETGEIESHINALEDVKKCIAHVVPMDNGESKFVLYYTSNGLLAHNELEAQIKQTLKSEIPESMRPTLFMRLVSFPHNPNGKVDRNKLPMPTIDSEYIPPESEVESYLHLLWADSLALEKVSIVDNFFELGGHSLLATKLVNKINDYYDIKLPLKSFFETASIKGCAEVIELELNKKVVIEEDSVSDQEETQGELDEFVI